VREEADTEARQFREHAEAEAGSHLARVQDAADRMLERARSAESEVERLLEGLRTGAVSLVGNLRPIAESLSGDLEQIRAGVPALREAPPSAGTGSSPTGVGVIGETAVDGSEADVTGEEEERPQAEEAPDEFAADAADPAAEREGDLGEDPPAGEVAPTEAEPIEGAEPAAIEEPILTDEAATIEDEPTRSDEPALAEDPTDDEEPESAEQPHDPAIAGSEGARLIALNMALNGTPRDETARYLSENFNLEDQDSVLDEVYSRVGS
jgi:hypothetical protein